MPDDVPAHEGQVHLFQQAPEPGAGPPRDDLEDDHVADLEQPGSGSDIEGFSPSHSVSVDEAGLRRWQSVKIFRLDHQPVELRIRWDRYEFMHRDICHQLRMPWRQLRTLYEVVHGPEDLDDADINPLILHQHQDLRTGEMLRMVLLDVQFHNPWPAAQHELRVR